MSRWKFAFLGTGLFLLAAAPAVHASSTGFTDSPPMVRVLVAEKRTSIQVAVKGGWVMRAQPGGAIVAQGSSLTVRLTPVAGGFRIQDKTIQATSLALEPKTERDLYLDRSRFRGQMRFYKDPKNLLFAVNSLDIENYLYGVLHHEVGAWWPMAALEAQAVAARTYALYQVQSSRAQLYDLKSSTSSQVYGGSTTERYRTKQAVNHTRGQVLTYKGKIFPAFFHATCAGRTAAADELWKISLPPLAGGVLCDYCRISPHYYWRASIPFSLIEGKLAASGRAVGQLLSVELVSRTPSYRVGSLRLTGNAGEAVIAAKDFRVWVGGDRLKSTSFTVECKDDSAIFKGKGWGHGVGLCQWGALGQALLGRKKAQILEYYYPGSEVASHESV